MTTLYICGAGNPEIIRLARAINQHAQRWDQLVLLDDDPRKQGGTLLDVEIAGAFDLLDDADPVSDEIVNYVARSMELRWSVRRRLQEFDLPFARLIHPLIDTSGTQLSGDIIIYENAVISPMVSIKGGCMVCMGALVTHECRLGRCCFVAPGAVLNSRANVGDGVFIGANATILPELSIGHWATIGAGAVVTQDVPDGATVFGAPARVIYQKALPPPGVDDWTSS